MVKTLTLKLEDELFRWVEAAADVAGEDFDVWIADALRRKVKIATTPSSNGVAGVSFSRGPDFTAAKLCRHCWSSDHPSDLCGVW